MQSFLVQLSKLFYLLRIWQLLLLCEGVFGWRKQFVVLLYHHLRADDETRQPLSKMEKGLLASTFQMQIETMRRWYTPISLAELKKTLDVPAKSSKDCLLVTFDDGYLDNRELAGPCLRRSNVSGLIFIATGLIESQQKSWVLHLNDIIERITPDGLKTTLKALPQFPIITEMMAQADLKDWQGRHDLRERMIAALEKVSEESRDAVLKVLMINTDFTLETRLPLLSWHDIEAMTNEGFEFGGHTVTHLKMTQSTSSENRMELEASAAELERRLGTRPTSFAYPFGEFDERVVSEVKQAGYRFAFTTRPGIVVPGKTSSLEIPRIQLYWTEPDRLLAFIVVLKLAKYFPRLVSRLISSRTGSPFYC